MKQDNKTDEKKDVQSLSERTIDLASISPFFNNQYGKPIIIEIKNSSYDRIVGFQLNNESQFSREGKFDERVYLSSTLVDEKYFSKSLYHELNNGLHIKKIRMEFHCDYEKYRSIQTTLPIRWREGDEIGNSIEVPVHPVYALNQFVQYVTDMPVDFKFKDSWGLSFILMPEIFIRLSLYPAIEKKD